MTISSPSVDTLNLSNRASNCLSVAGIRTIGELAGKTKADLLKTRYFGRKSVKEIRDALASQYQIDLKPD